MKQSACCCLRLPQRALKSEVYARVCGLYTLLALNVTLEAAAVCMSAL